MFFDPMNAASGPRKRATSVGGRRIVGWREWLVLPELNVPSIKAKIDTGARTSALHAFEVELFQREGVRMVRFKIHPEQRSLHPTIPAEAELVDERAVRSSSGRSEMRPVIRTTARLFEVDFPLEVTLTSRDAMGFRMLVGRQALRKRFVVDPARSYVGGRREGSSEKHPVKKPRAKGYTP
jgi:hypothetical protein